MTGHEPAQRDAVSVHACHIADHARRVGLAALADDRDALGELGDLHPRLQPLGDAAQYVTDAHIAQATARPVAYPDGRAMWGTFPLGDDYQALSVEAVKGRALCQTPRHIAEFLLELSMRRAWEDKREPRLIDPACGTGHILIEAYHRARYGWPGRDVSRPASVADALSRIAGVDLDPWAATVAAYRLIVRAWCDLRHDTDDPAAVASLPINVDVGDSLLGDSPLLTPGGYDVVVANPPYIVSPTTDYAHRLRAAYSEATTYRKFSLALPFHELMMRLLARGGWYAQLTANSFMKRVFGKKYVEDWLPRFHLEWVIDTSGAYIPGHGTPTVILAGRNCPPMSDTVGAVMGIRGTPGRPSSAAECPVSQSIERGVLEKESWKRLGRAGALAGERSPLPVVELGPVRPHQPSLFDLGLAS